MSTTQLGTTTLWLSLLVFTCYFANVMLGSPMGRGLSIKPWFGDVAEMTVLLIATVLFVIGILCREQDSASSP